MHFIKDRRNLAGIQIVVQISINFVPLICCQIARSESGPDSNFVAQSKQENARVSESAALKEAISKLESKVMLSLADEGSKRALAELYRQRAHVLNDSPTESLESLHKSCFLEPSEPKYFVELASLIKTMGKDPNDFKTRVTLGDSYTSSAKYFAAIVEYQEALRLKLDALTYEKLGDVYRIRGEDDKSVAQYKYAAEMKDTARVEGKISELYRMLDDSTRAQEAHNKALKLREAGDTTPDESIW
jgi:tetratricopeptide (TPR) repeat protein